MKKTYEKIAEILGGILFLAIVATTFTEVISRKFFSHSFPWSQEIPCFLMVALGLLGASVGVLRDSHINITLITDAFKPRIRQVIFIIGDLISLGFCVVTALNSNSVIKAMSKRTATGSGINMGIVYSLLPFFLAIMAVFLVVRIFGRIKNFPPKGAGKEGKEA